MDELKYLTDYYNNYDEDKRLTTKYGLVEFLTTMKYINKFLKKGMRVLEVGAGTGRYSLTIAEQGFKVDAIELIQHNIDIFKSKITKNCNIDVRQGNAIDLSSYEDETFDITLVLGPLYHLFNEDDKRLAISEAIRVTKKGGVVFISYCMNDATIVNWGFQKSNIIEGIQNGIVDGDTFKCLSNPSLLFEMYRKEEIDELMERYDIERLHFVATDLLTNHMRNTIDEMDEKMFEAYLKYHFSICERIDLVGITHHSLDIFRKK
ncbi:bifunctional 2-polyprenyl-6-hydroxyphenol methylase/3-demethylubiquinol 3-O-methyltransferase UbiG [Clostridium sp. YIM B02551]|uniref:class I SAM-dependent methyltransferase n=1 Tax=Clostridium sp. YIM B02551 TaxID=2910679 RepID=UPI001EECD91F|nr:class I SAM-dependent methyltransferase [Clostridium sp. YIM B02551]